MRSVLLFASIAFIFCSACRHAPPGARLDAEKFAKKIKATPNGIVLDVRTPDEYAKGHIVNAVNIDWNGIGFDYKISKLDKSHPVFVYCLSGSRSASAAYKMRSEGFNVYELKGGILKWRAANLPETDKISGGMSRSEFDSLLRTDKLLLVDFYADWCAPCREMKPYLDEISSDMKGQVVVVRINVDDNQSLCRELKIEALPVLQLYKHQQLTWENEGYIRKEDVIKKLQSI